MFCGKTENAETTSTTVVQKHNIKGPMVFFAGRILGSVLIAAAAFPTAVIVVAAALTIIIIITAIKARAAWSAGCGIFRVEDRIIIRHCRSPFSRPLVEPSRD
jgi:hypothetical protein